MELSSNCRKGWAVVMILMLLTTMMPSFSFSESNGPASSRTNDIQHHWAENVIQEWIRQGLVKGYPDGTMKPEVHITRQEVAVILSKIAALEGNTIAAAVFTDASNIPDWSRGAIGAVAEARLMGGYPDGSFKPVNNTTRAEALVALNKAKNMHQEEVQEEEEKEIEEEETPAPPSKPSTGGGGGGGGSTIVPVTGVTLTPANLTLTAGGATKTLTAILIPTNATNKKVIWKTSDPTVATVEKGVITPIAAGTATITVTTANGGYTATSQITVISPSEEEPDPKEPDDTPIMTATPQIVTANPSFNQKFTLKVKNDTVTDTVYTSDITLTGVFSELELIALQKIDANTVTAQVYGNLETGIGIITLEPTALLKSKEALNAEITVQSPTAVTAKITATPETIANNQSTELSWTTTNADTITIDQGIGEVEASGSIEVTPAETTTYTLTASGYEGTATASVTVSVYNSNQPTIQFTALSQMIQQGETTNLIWSSQQGETAHIDQGIGTIATNGSYQITPQHTTQYTLTVTGETGSANAKVTVKVLGNPNQQSEGSFGEPYNDLIPEDATLDEYDQKRFSLITGIVQDINNQPIEDVAISLYNKPEYGTVYTDPEGRFTIPVEGGENLTLKYQKNNYISAQRHLYVPWNDIAVADTIQMLKEDPLSTTITFDGNPETILTHRSTPVTDEFGTRSLTMTFTGDNTAWLVDEKGNDIHPLPTITVRATEFETQESMPSVLPPNTAYTYCAELTVEGAERVRFEEPVIIWVENFLEFPVGEIVPVGYFDRDRNVWVPSENGVVVRLLDTDGDGIVDALDTTGDGQPDISDHTILKGLEDSSIYIPGTTFWTAAITHFTPWDCNWPYGPPLGAIAPPSGDGKGVPQKQQSLIFHEAITIPGTNTILNYASDRVGGYETIITIPASGETVPDSLKEIIVELQIAGRVFTETLPPDSNQIVEFKWDGLDNLGKKVTRSVPARASVGYVYPAVYYMPSEFSSAFNQPGIPPASTFSKTSRQEIIIWTHTNVDAFSHQNHQRAYIAEGWALSLHHQLLLGEEPTLLRGNGSSSKVNDMNFHETFIRFNGTIGELRKDILLKQASSDTENYPTSLTVDAEGNIYATVNHRILKIDANGISTTIAGNDISGYSGDDGPAEEAQLDFPIKTVLDAYGNLYIADIVNQRIRKIDANGIITTVAGNGDSGYNGDDRPAEEASLNFPQAIALDAYGNLYIADTDNQRIRKVDPNGIITTFAGNGSYGYSGDGGPAEEASLNFPQGITLDAYGNLYIADTDNQRIRKVDPSGIIATVAGNGDFGYEGDGGPALEASMSGPRDINVDNFGNLYIADISNNRIRKIYPDGTITTIAGNGQSDDGEMEASSFGGESLINSTTMNNSKEDDGPALLASFKFPMGIALSPSREIYIADTANQRISKVSAPPSIIADAMGDAAYAFIEGDIFYTFSITGQHKKTIDLATGVTLYEFLYNDNNQLRAIKNRFGRQMIIQRDNNGKAEAIISPDGIRTDLTIDANNRLTRVTYPDNTDYDFHYTQEGLLTQITDFNRNSYNIRYDDNGRLSSISDSEGGEWQYTQTLSPTGEIYTEIRSAEGLVTSFSEKTDFTGAYTQIVKDPTGAQITNRQLADKLNHKEYLPDGTIITYQYNLDSKYYNKYIEEIMVDTPLKTGITAQSQKTYQDTNGDGRPNIITTMTTANGKTTTTRHDLLQSKITVTSPEGRTVTAAYNPDTLLIEQVDVPGFLSTHYQYDENGRLRYTRTGSRQTELQYNQRGFLSTIIAPDNRTITYQHDPIGQITAIQRADATTVYYTYDNNGNLITLTTPGNIDHEYDYNKVNAATRYRTPESGDYNYIYNRDRQLTQTITPEEKQTRYNYDKGKLLYITTPEGETIAFEYMDNILLKEITKHTESITYSYIGSIITAKTMKGILNKTLEYTYNDDLDIASLTYAGKTEAYMYDNDGLLTVAGNFIINRNQQNGFPETITDNNLTINRTYNGYGEIQSNTYTITDKTPVAWSLDRDNIGNITQKTEILNGQTIVYTYTYDELGRLLTATQNGIPIETYQYDTKGRRKTATNQNHITQTNYSYTNEDHLLNAGNTQYQYDLDGYLTQKTVGEQTTTYHYSSAGELVKVTLPEGKEIQYLHDALGKRIAWKENGVIKEKYLWEGLSLLAVYDGNDNLKIRFAYADTPNPISMEKEGVTYYLLYDQIGSLRAVTDASGNIIKTIAYDSFGNIIEETNPDFAIPLGFAGGLHDRDTGLVRFGARDYDPDTGRWTAKDPIFFAGGDTDLYGYCYNDPVNYVDPNGYYMMAIEKAYHIAAPKIAPYANEISMGLQKAGEFIVQHGPQVAEGIVNIAKDVKEGAKNAANTVTEKLKDLVGSDGGGSSNLDPNRFDKGGSNFTEISKSAERQIKKLSPEAKKSFDKVMDAFESGDMRGLNEHALKGNRKGQWAVDLKGIGKGRGAGRVIYEKLSNGGIKIIEILTDHNY